MDNDLYGQIAKDMIADAEQKGLPWYAGLFNPKFISAISGIPDEIVELSKRKHGRWVTWEEPPFIKGCVCSECGQVGVGGNYCSHCGAKMDGDIDASKET